MSGYKTNKTGSLKRSQRIGILFGLLTLALGLGLTYFVQQVTINIEHQRLQQIFDDKSHDFKLRIDHRLASYQQVLESVTALFNASDNVSREEFKTYVSKLRLTHYYPGIQAIGFNKVIHAQEKISHINAIKNEGFPLYNIHPEGERDIYVPATYVEPFNGSNLRTFGFDMFFEAERRKAMEIARDTGLVTISGKIKLLQETSSQIQAGALLFFPVYANGKAHETMTERRVNILGWVYAAFRMDDLMFGIVGARDQEIDFEIFDDEQIILETLMYDSDYSLPLSLLLVKPPLYQALQTIKINDHSWALKSNSLPVFDAQFDSNRILMVRVFGTIVSVLMSLVIWQLVAGRNRAIDVSKTSALALVESEKQKKKVLTELQHQKYALDQHAIVAITDVNGTITYANDYFCESSGYEQSEILGQNHRFLNSGTHPREFFSGMFDCLTAGKVWRGEICNRSKIGKLYWIKTTITPLLTDNGKPLEYIAIGTNITEPKLTAEQLRLSDIGLNSISQGVLIADSNRCIQWTNLAFEHITGYSLQDIVGKNCRFLQGADTDPATMAVMRESLNNVTEFNAEIINYRKDGSPFWNELTISPLFDDQGQLTHYIGIARDITSRKAIEIQLLESESRLRNILNNSPIAVCISLKMEREVVFYNQRYLDLIGGIKLLDINPDQFYVNIEDYQGIVDELAQGHSVLNQKLELSQPEDDSSFWVLASFMSIQYQNKDAVLAWFYDITMEHEAALVLLHAKELAEETTRLKSDFLANMSHEIRTPMNGVLGMLDLLCETELTATQLSWVRTAHGSAEALLDVVNDILDLSQLEAIHLVMESISFNLVDLVDEVCALLAVRAHQKGLELNCYLPNSVHSNWQGDPMRIRQVLTNLIGNAIKFTDLGEISVTVLPKKNNNNELRFEVRDTGIGISKENMSRLFKSFSQAESTTLQKFGGTGLGLFISKKIVEMMGGKIGADSVPGRGSCFWFTLPLTQIKQSQTVKQSFDFSGKRALVVVGNTTNRNALVNYLNSWGLDVHEVDNGAAALIELKRSASSGFYFYDLIVLDREMPVMNGLTLSKKLAKIPDLAKIPIILLSCNSHLDLSNYQDTGIVVRLLKPVRQTQLLDAISNALNYDRPAMPVTAGMEMDLPNYQNKKVLVIEDNPVNQKVILAKLGRFNIVPDLAENGQLALTILEQGSYDLIFMDCIMPVMDGYSTTRQLRLLEARRGLPHQPVIALTANALEGESDKCLAAGMDGYLTKPVITEQLTDVLACYLAKQSFGTDSAIVSQTFIPPVWDEAATLEHLDNDSAMLGEMIVLFLIEIPKQISTLTSLQTEINLPELARVAHLIKGTVGYFYAATAKECALILEQAALSGQVADLQRMTEVLINAMTELTKALQLKLDLLNQANS